jgi:hypothetical protein
MLDIVATDANGERFHCFTWTRDAASGIARAEREAKEFGREELRDFAAIERKPDPAQRREVRQMRAQR